MKVGRGTRNFLHEAAMTPEEMELCLEHGAQCVDTSHQEGCNIISFGEWESEILRPLLYG